MDRSEEFFPTLFAGYPDDPALRLEVRCLPPTWDRERERPWPRRWFCLEPAYLANALSYARSLSCEWDCYFGVLPRREHEGGQNGVPHARCLYADVDGGERGWEAAVALVRNSGLPHPDIAVASGGGLHCYWLLPEAEPLRDREAREGYKRVLRRLVLAIGGKSPGAHADAAACECARVLRIPSTSNLKRKEEPRPVRLLRLVTDTLLMPYRRWMSELPPEPQATAVRQTIDGYTAPGIVSSYLLGWAERGYPEGKRHQSLLGAGYWLVYDCHLDRRDALVLLWRKAQHSPGRRAIPYEEVKQIIDWV